MRQPFLDTQPARQQSISGVDEHLDGQPDEGTAIVARDDIQRRQQGQHGTEGRVQVGEPRRYR